MNDELERMLKAQPLREPPERLDGRVARTLRAGRHRAGWGLALSAAAGLLLAAAGLGGLLGPGGTDRSGPSEPAVTAVTAGDPQERDEKAGPTIRIEQVRRNYEAGQLLLLDAEWPMRPVVEQTVEQVIWWDEAEQVYMEVSRPWRQILLVQEMVD